MFQLARFDLLFELARGSWGAKELLDARCMHDRRASTLQLCGTQFDQPKLKEGPYAVHGSR